MAFFKEESDFQFQIARGDKLSVKETGERMLILHSSLFIMRPLFVHCASWVVYEEPKRSFVLAQR